MSQILLQYFDSDGCDAAWQSVLALRQEIAGRRGAAPPLATWQELRRDRTKAEGVSDPDLHALLIEDRVPKAYIFTQQASGGTNDPTRMLDFDVLDEEPSAELAAAFRQELLKRMYAKRAPALYARAVETRQMNLMKAIGARVADTLNAYRLDRGDLDTDLLRSERTRLLAVNPGIALRIAQYLDESTIADFARLFTIFRNSMAGSSRDHGEVTVQYLRHREAKPGDPGSQLHMLAYDGDRMIGHTNIWLDLRNPTRLNQYMTGVVPEYRGREIGLLLKSALYLELERLTPEWSAIYTDTLSTNVYMQAINERLGFRQVGQGYRMMLLPE